MLSWLRLLANEQSPIWKLPVKELWTGNGREKGLRVEELCRSRGAIRKLIFRPTAEIPAPDCKIRETWIREEGWIQEGIQEPISELIIAVPARQPSNAAIREWSSIHECIWTHETIRESSTREWIRDTWQQLPLQLQLDLPVTTNKFTFHRTDVMWLRRCNNNNSRGTADRCRRRETLLPLHDQWHQRQSFNRGRPSSPEI